MPLYEYRCEICDVRFELRRSVSESGASATCPNGHDHTRRLLSVFATAGRSGPGPALGQAPVGGGGGCCGGACGCGAR